MALWKNIKKLNHHLLGSFYIFICCISFTTFSSAQGWNELGSGVNALKANGLIASLATDSGGVVYAAGQFTSADTTPAIFAYVAKWDGTKWTELGTGLNALRVTAPILSICVDKWHNVYAAGIFVNAAGYSYVAKWDGSHWSELGTGTSALNANGAIWPICADTNGNIYAGGSFTDGVTSYTGNNYVAKWDGTTWSKLGAATAYAIGDTGGFVNIVPDSLGNLYATGGFCDTATHVPKIFKWDGTYWSMLPNIPTHSTTKFPNGRLISLRVGPGGKLYAGGGFTNAAGYAYVAEWDGTGWNEVGAGGASPHVNVIVGPISTDSKGNVYAAAQIDTVAYVYVWNGTGWVDLATGSHGLNPNNGIFALAIDDYDNLYAGGNFTNGANKYSGYRYVAQTNYAKLGVAYEQQRNDIIAIYPNPSNSFLHIALPPPYPSMAYSMYDCAGKLALKGEINNGLTRVDISSLAQGIYLFKLNNNFYKIEKK